MALHRRVSPGTRGFDGRAVLVTGGSRGIGRAIAERFAAEEAEVMISGRGRMDLERTAAEMRGAGGRVWAVAGDIAEEADLDELVEAAIDRWGRIDVLVNNAALSLPEPFLDLGREKWDRVLAAGLSAPFALSQRVARHMCAAGRGVIVNIGSIAAHGANANVAYGVVKAGVLALTSNIALELAPAGVRCVAVSPGLTDTQMVARRMPAKTVARLRGGGFKRAPLGRLITVEEVAAAVAFAAGDEASGVTGCEILVDGGLVNSLYATESLQPGR